MTKRKEGPHEKPGPKGPRIQLTDEQIIQVEALGAVLSVQQICDYFGFSTDTWENMCARDPEIARRYKKGKSKAVASVATCLLSKAIAGDNACMFFYLKTQAQWREITVIQDADAGKYSQVLRIERVIIDEAEKSDTSNQDGQSF